MPDSTPDRMEELRRTFVSLVQHEFGSGLAEMDAPGTITPEHQREHEEQIDAGPVSGHGCEQRR